MRLGWSLRADAARLADIDAAIAELQSERDNILTRRSISADGKPKLAPISTISAAELPSDILIEVFKHLCPIFPPAEVGPWGWYSPTAPAVPTSRPPSMPLTLSHVCEAWRASAIATRELWSTICLRIQIPTKPSWSPPQVSIERILSGALALDLHNTEYARGRGALELLRLFLGRTASAELDLATPLITSPSRRSPRYDGDDEDEEDDEASVGEDGFAATPPVEVLIADLTTCEGLTLILAHCERWNKIRLSPEVAFALERLHFAAASSLGALAWSNLRGLKISDQINSDLNAVEVVLFSDSPELVQLAIRSDIRVDVPWAQLTRLDIEVRGVEDTLAILRRTPALTELLVLPPTWGWSQPASEFPISSPIVLNELRKLSVATSDRALLDNLIVPNLVELELDNISNETEFALRTLHQRSPRADSETTVRCLRLALTPGSDALIEHLLESEFLQDVEELHAFPAAHAGPGVWGLSGRRGGSAPQRFHDLLAILTPRAPVTENIDLGSSSGSEPDSRFIPCRPLLVPRLRSLTLDDCDHPLDVFALQWFVEARVSAPPPAAQQLDVHVRYSAEVGRRLGVDKPRDDAVEQAFDYLKDDLGLGRVRMTFENVPRRWDAKLNGQMISEMLQG
ncbi:hypothetical protein MKEN_00963700 [Mycena kentingensis (nom. inval.)]|nr:hypothetical protein MKEN_00963700 [Mycena kentingensis (nom. inval.)]